MSQFPQPPSSPSSFPPQPVWQFAPPVRTSGMAVASIILGSIGMFTCCALVPNVLAVVFAGVAFPAIKRGEVKGRGVAIAGLVLGILGTLIGATFWAVVAMSPSSHAIPGNLVKARDRATLERIGAIEKDEPIVLFFSGGFSSIRESGAIITATRLIAYSQGDPTQKANLAEIKRLKFTPATSWLDDSEFTVTLDDGQTLTFVIDSMEGADRQFDTALKLAVKEARKAIDKATEFSETNAEEPAAEEDSQEEDESAPPTERPSANRPR